jgi:hypothetical protein
MRERRELCHGLRAAGEREPMVFDRLDVRLVGVEHDDVGNLGEAGSDQSANRAGADDEDLSL